MSTQPATPADQAAAQVTCLCGATWSEHRGKDHPFTAHPRFYSATLPRGVDYSRDDLNPAVNLYVTVEDRLRVSILCQTAATEVDVIARIQRPDGQVIPMLQQIKPASSAAIQNFEFDLTEGFLLDVSATTPTAAIRVGAIFVIVELIRGTGANAFASRVLVSNFVSTSVVIGWPEGPNQASVQNAGQVTASLGGNPGAGNEINIQVPAGVRWLLQSFNTQLTTSATVANRTPHIRITDAAGNLFWDCAASAAQAASLTVQYSACGGVQPTFNDNSAIFPVPDVMMLLQGWRIRTLTTNLQAGDTWLNPNVNVISWPEL